jgi:hypothetical protein
VHGVGEPQILFCCCPSTSTAAKVGHRPRLLSSRLERSVGEGPAVSLDGEAEPGGFAHDSFAVPETETAGPLYLDRGGI